MLRALVAVGFLVSVTMVMSGCTSWAGISKADKPGTYYLVKNKNLGILGIRTGVLLCTSDAKTGDLNCKGVEAKNERD